MRGGEGKQVDRSVVMRNVVGMLCARDKIKGVVMRGKQEVRFKKSKQLRDKKWKQYAKGKVLEALNRMESRGEGIFAGLGGRRKKRKL